MKSGRWATEQIDYLREYYPFVKAEDIGDVIGRTKLSVQHKAHNLGIVKTKESFFKVRSDNRKGDKTPNFKGYRRRTPKGYIAIYKPEHPSASKAGMVMEHRLIVEEHLGYVLPPEFDVHHINGNKQDNRIENLAILTHGAHTALHNKKGTK